MQDTMQEAHHAGEPHTMNHEAPCTMRRTAGSKPKPPAVPTTTADQDASTTAADAAMLQLRPGIPA